MPFIPDAATEFLFDNKVIGSHELIQEGIGIRDFSAWKKRYGRREVWGRRFK
ncbi:hypothetical protein [Anditalea andensis]|uniref:hypothetical protein n=1 Tax=Anditalea andensis TaxID=1048983 RepID=UPI0013DF046E|nr:hypothetical protein [Anditalea andensis]